ncbi:MAG: hypothetical protein WC506_06730 [Candidatus Micrarchaeia archaeon]
MISKNQKMLAGLLLFAVFIFLLYYVPELLKQNSPPACRDEANCLHEEYIKTLSTYFPAFVLLGFVFGVMAAYLYFEKKIDVPGPHIDRKKAFLSVLGADESKVLEKILEGGGQAMQASVSRLEGLGKVKTHRTVEKLVRRGVLVKEQVGKTNLLKLKKELRDALFK